MEAALLLLTPFRMKKSCDLDLTNEQLNCWEEICAVLDESLNPNNINFSGFKQLYNNV